MTQETKNKPVCFALFYSVSIELGHLLTTLERSFPQALRRIFSNAESKKPKVKCVENHRNIMVIIRNSWEHLGGILTMCGPLL